MKQFLITTAGVFAGLLLFLVGVPFLLIVMAAGAARPAPLPSAVVLQLDLRDPLTDQEPQNPLVGFGQRSHAVMSIVEALDAAEDDKRIKGLLVRLPEQGVAPGSADELRQAIKRFRAAGKPVYAHSQGLYPAGVATSTYMLGAAADEFWMQPGAPFQATGVATEEIFFKRFFDRYGIEPDFERRREFKTAPNGFLYSDFTPEHRASLVSWMGSIYGSSLAQAAADRKQAPAALRTTLEAGPYGAEEAHRLKLIDRLGHVKAAETALLEKAGEGAELKDFQDYIRSRRAARAVGGSGPAIAVVEAEGPIVTGRDGTSNPFAASTTIYSDDVSEAIYDAVEDDAVKAIVFRVNSPGGSDVASEQILEAVRAAKKAGKPVVVSMATYAASGGYWISSEASAIVAQPSTLTGSIGVFGGKFALGDALARFGVDVRDVSLGGDFADAYAISEGFTPAQRAEFSAWMDQIYGNFLTRVAQGRNLPMARVQEIARGRVWTGAQARQLGLVDELGGFYDAVDKAKALAKLEGEVRLKRLTPQASPLEAIERALGVQAASARTLAAAAWIFGDPRAEAILEDVAQARMRADGAHVLAPTPIR